MGRAPALGLAVVALVAAVAPARGMNWAQGSGVRAQPVAKPFHNAWTSRWGHALVADEGEGMMYLLGGDDYRGAEDGGGQTQNDVWRTSGASWNVLEKVLTGEPLLYSQLQWERVRTSKRPPVDVDYESWIACESRRWQGAPGCAEDEDPYRLSRRWSPRRSHRAVYFDKGDGSGETLWVIGGRATDEPGSDHEVKLKNDVWTSADGGTTWRLVNPGCRFEDTRAWPNLGAEHANCRSDIECYGDSRCVNLLTDLPASNDPEDPWNRCRCNTFRPRERFGLAVHQGKLFVSGGITNVKVSFCGSKPCNGGYEQVADDLWSSPDGEIWTRHVEVSHRYADHGLIESEGLLWIVSLHQDPVLALSSNSSAQEHRSPDRGVFLAGVPFPRSDEQQLIEDDVFDEKFVYIENNDVVYKYVEGSGWRRVAEETNNVRGTMYVWPDAPVERIQGGITPEEVATLEANGVRTIRDLTTLGAQQVVDLRGLHDVLYICRYVKRAIAVVNKCKVYEEFPDGFANYTHNVQPVAPMTHPNPRLRAHLTDSSQGDVLGVVAPTGAAAAAAAADAAASAEAMAADQAADEADSEGHYIYGHDGCQQAELIEERFAHLDEIPQLVEDAERGFVPDLTCRWGFPARTNLGAVNFGGKQYVVGGRVRDRPENLVLEERGDTWYRDDTVPVTLIPIRPEDGTSETSFVFECDEEGCLYEYMIELLDADAEDAVLETLVEWTRSTGVSLDLLSWLPGGRYRLKARAIDPAGNVDNQFSEGRNVHTWTYVPRIPLGLIMGIVMVFLLIGLFVYLEIRRRKKKAALERYALKRLRRKFKNMSKQNQREGKKKGKKGKKGKKKKGGDKSGDGDGKKKKSKKKSKKKKGDDGDAGGGKKGKKGGKKKGGKKKGK